MDTAVQIYVKIVPASNFYLGHTFNTGLNTIQTPENFLACPEFGFYFTTTANVETTYYAGLVIWTVQVPDDAHVVQIREHDFYSDALILIKPYSLFNIKTYEILNLDALSNPNYLQHCIISRDVESIRKLNMINPRILSERLTEYAYKASVNCCYDLLEWLAIQTLPFECHADVARIASQQGDINVLEFWKKTGKLVYDEKSITIASRLGEIEVLEWWVSSGLPLKYDTHAMDTACIASLNWWVLSGLELKYSTAGYYYALYYNINALIEWWTVFLGR